MQIEFSGPVFTWRGPAPYFFVGVPQDEADQIQELAAALTYGWGMIPAAVTIGNTEWDTALWPKDGRYVVPLKAWVRKDEGIEEGQVLDVRLSLAV